MIWGCARKTEIPRAMLHATEDGHLNHVRFTAAKVKQFPPGVDTLWFHARLGMVPQVTRVLFICR